MNKPPALWEEEVALQGPCSPAPDCCKAGMKRDLGQQQEIRDPRFPPEAPGKVRNIPGTKQALENEVQRAPLESSALALLGKGGIISIAS